MGLAGRPGEPDEARQHRRHLDHRQQLLGAAHLAAAAAAEQQRHVERLVAELREGVALVDRQRREGRPHLGHEVGAGRGGLLRRELLRRHQPQAGLGQARHQRLAPEPVLPLHQGVGPLRDGLQHLGRLQAVHRALGDLVGHLGLQAGHPDHEELVEVGGDDAEELEPLQHRQAGLLGLLQDPLVEGQPGELPVEEERGVGRVGGAGGVGGGGQDGRHGRSGWGVLEREAACPQSGSGWGVGAIRRRVTMGCRSGRPGVRRGRRSARPGRARGGAGGPGPGRAPGPGCALHCAAHEERPRPPARRHRRRHQRRPPGDRPAAPGRHARDHPPGAGCPSAPERGSSPPVSWPGR